MVLLGLWLRGLAVQARLVAQEVAGLFVRFAFPLPPVCLTRSVGILDELQCPTTLLRFTSADGREHLPLDATAM